ncbi:MAG: class I SAM-dependent methyltransferase [Methylovulum sp.]|nr:class I SAM-dependent methyltransferase [Methylovulum sp.]
MTTIIITESQLKEIYAVEEFAKNGDYNKLDIIKTIDYMNKLYIDSISKHNCLSESVLCDCGAGFGWLSFAFLLAGGKKVVIVEPHKNKLIAAKKIAKILKVDSQCEFRSDYLQAIDLPDNAIDIFVSVETLEHVGEKNIIPSIDNMLRLTKSMVIVTTPNQISPWVSHDSKVIFSHWLPITWRPFYCRLFGNHNKTFNHFVKPWQLFSWRKKFVPISKALTFESYEAWLAHYPFYSPYGGHFKQAPSWPMKLYFRIISTLFGRYSFCFCPNLASVWIAKAKK